LVDYNYVVRKVNQYGGKSSMSKKYEQLAKDIIMNVGGSDNVSDVYHCQTRLRFKLVDENKASVDTLQNIEGVATALISGGVFQVVIGTHVKDVFIEIEKLVTLKESVQTTNSEKKPILETIIDFVSGTFQPIIPALSGAGMVKAVLALFVVFNIISTDSQTYYILNFFADGVFYFLPILLAFSQAQKLKCNPILAVSVAAIMMHPNWEALIIAGESVAFFGIIPFTLTSYIGSVIPIILVVLVQSKVEKLLEKWIPSSVTLVFVPMLTFLIMGTLALSVLGPIGSILGGYLANFFTFLSVNVSWAPAVIIGGFLPLMVMFGLHNAVAPLGVMQMSNLGYDSIFGPGCVCSNIAQATASLVVSLRTKDTKVKQVAISGAVTAYMGITEPTLYGVILPKKYPLIASMIGGGLGGLYAGITQTHRFATGSSGLPAVLLYIGDDTMRLFYNIIIALLISAVSTAIITYILSLKYEKKDPDLESTQHANIAATKETLTILSPMKGKVLPLSEVSDEAFASEALGKGIAIVPTDGKVIAPFDGTVLTLFPTKHAIGLQTDDGKEVLIHIGFDTVHLKGEGFQTYVEQGQKVKAGDTLMVVDLDKITAAGYKTETPIVFTNATNYKNITAVNKEYIDYQEELLKISI
jgi:PTS system, glucose subfamily, IIA component